eukprot:TRINITY_DN17509_c0_g2_i1.p1 TRINITY_DN17509_c0_g2~~TRINITY_DN17509_c0_g2_i1.p1  ORF type:complete len:699 (+),score=104.38 TRINITY_DN17509_c0_g2_i1:56-2152(+)
MPTLLGKPAASQDGLDGALDESACVSTFQSTLTEIKAANQYRDRGQTSGRWSFRHFYARVSMFTPRFSRFSRRSTTGKHIQVLKSTVPGDLLRGVPSDVALEGLGVHWRSSAGSEDDYSRSEVTIQIDDFISHDWQTPRLTKFAALCFVYNLVPAMVTTFCYCALMTCLLGVCWMAQWDVGGAMTPAQLAEISWCTYSSPLVFTLTLAYWQRVRRLCSGIYDLVFVDKLCIDQGNEDTKRQCILGLAGYLRQSRRLVVLWSPRYLTRLWCTYELTSWFYLKGVDRESVKLVPVHYACSVLCWLYALIAFFATQELTTDTSNMISMGSGMYDDDEFMLWFGVPSMLAFPGVCLFVYCSRGAGTVFDQVDNFDIRQAKSFCCTHQHRHPISGAQLTCDRELVFATLQKWFAKCEMCQATYDGFNHLDAFESIVRRALQDVLGTRSVAKSFHLSYTDILLASCPVIWRTFDWLRYVARTEGAVVSLRWAIESVVLVSCILPCAARLIICIDHILSCCASGPICRALSFVVSGVSGFIVLFLLWLPSTSMVRYATLWPQLSRFLAMGLVTIMLFRFQIVGNGREADNEANMQKEQEESTRISESRVARQSGSEPASATKSYCGVTSSGSKLLAGVSSQNVSDLGDASMKTETMSTGSRSIRAKTINGSASFEDASETAAAGHPQPPCCNAKLSSEGSLVCSI